MGKPPWRSRIAYAVSAALGALVASIALPAAVITAHAVATGDAGEVSRFALTVAEPLGLLGAALGTYGIGRLAARRPDGRDLIPWVGGAAAAGMIGAALWFLDADLWTAAAAIALPATALLAGRGARLPAPDGQESGPAPELRPAPPEPPSPERERETVRHAP